MREKCDCMIALVRPRSESLWHYRQDALSLFQTVLITWSSNLVTMFVWLLLSRSLCLLNLSILTLCCRIITEEQLFIIKLLSNLVTTFVWLLLSRSLCLSPLHPAPVLQTAATAGRDWEELPGILAQTRDQAPSVTPSTQIWGQI